MYKWRKSGGPGVNGHSPTQAQDGRHVDSAFAIYKILFYIHFIFEYPQINTSQRLLTENKLF